MRKYFKLLTVVLFFTVILGGLSACSNEMTSEDLVGKWKMNFTDTEDPEVEIFRILVLNENGTGSMSPMYINGKVESYDKNKKIDMWYVENNTIHIQTTEYDMVDDVIESEHTSSESIKIKEVKDGGNTIEFERRKKRMKLVWTRLQ